MPGSVPDGRDRADAALRRGAGTAGWRARALQRRHARPRAELDLPRAAAGSLGVPGDRLRRRARRRLWLAFDCGPPRPRSCRRTRTPTRSRCSSGSTARRSWSTRACRPTSRAPSATGSAARGAFDRRDRRPRPVRALGAFRRAASEGRACRCGSRSVRSAARDGGRRDARALDRDRRRAHRGRGSGGRRWRDRERPPARRRLTRHDRSQGPASAGGRAAPDRGKAVRAA